MSSVLFNYCTMKPTKYQTTGAEEQNRTADTAVFSRVLYQLSYLGTALVCGYSILNAGDVKREK